MKTWRPPPEFRMCACLERSYDERPESTVAAILAGLRKGLPVCEPSCETFDAEPDALAA